MLKNNMIKDEYMTGNANIEDLENMFQNLNVNKIKYNQKYFAGYVGSSRHYYTKSTPEDILFEENIQHFLTSFSGSQIYCWNIDGINKYQILGVMHQIMMYSTACQTNENSKKDITLMIICGFMGALNGWWDNYLTPAQRSKILTAVKHEINEAGVTVEKIDIIYTLIQAIIYHFIGSLNNNIESHRYLLQNLKCVSLSHF